MKRISIVLAIPMIVLVVLFTAPKNAAAQTPTPTPTWSNHVGKLDLDQEICVYNTGYLILEDGTRVPMGMPEYIYIGTFNKRYVWIRGADDTRICPDVPVFSTYYWSPVTSYQEPWPEGEREVITGYLEKQETLVHDWTLKQSPRDIRGAGLIVEHNTDLVRKIEWFALTKTEVVLEVVRTVDSFGTIGEPAVWWVFDARPALALDYKLFLPLARTL